MTELRIQTAKVFRPLLTPLARYLGAYGGRGSAKSQFFAGLAVERSVMDATDIVCLRQVQKSLKFSVKRAIEKSIERMNAGAYFTVQDKQILSRAASGGRGTIIFEGLQDHTKDSIKSLEDFDVFLIEEGQSITHKAFETLRPTPRKPGSQIWCAWNPEDPEDAVDAFFRGPVKHPGAIVVATHWRENPWFTPELESERAHDARVAERTKNHASYAHVWDGAYVSIGDAQVFRNWKVEEFETLPGATLRYGADWGFAIDPSVLVRCYLEGRCLYIDHEAWQLGCEIDRLPDLFMQVPQAERWPLVADSSRPETISYMRAHGFPRMTAAIKGPGSLEDGVQWLQALEIVVHPRCVRTAQELRTYAYKTDEATGKPIPVLQDKNNHLIDALRYACESARRAASQVKPVHVVPIPQAAPYARR